ncbi:MAG: hypothetical protein JO110_08425 [Acetobacteraceae bacterium]|nr:hypothetical protein [Acetobacteraceae bacterium]
MRFTSLAHLLTPEFLRETWGMINRHGAGGVDGESIEQFESTLEQRLQDICERLKAGAYQAPPVRRVEIPKGPGKTGTRPLGIPTVADPCFRRRWHAFSRRSLNQTFATPVTDIDRDAAPTTLCARYASRS